VHHETDDTIARIATAAMQEEAARTQPGFENLPSIEVTPTSSGNSLHGNPWTFRKITNLMT
jgi:hypothetical protein